MSAEQDRDIKKTLESIFEYIGADKDYADSAAVQSMLERLIERNS